MSADKYDVVVVGGGFTGLAAAYELSRQGKRVRVVESDFTPGGMAGTFPFADGIHIEKFYHHWFNSDVYVRRMLEEVGLVGDVITVPSRTGMYFQGRLWRLSTPMDLLRFNALSFIGRIRLGLLVFRVRRIKDWRTIEHLSIRQWLEPMCGKDVFRIVWEPLILSKFSIYAEAVSAVWMWKKLVLRGSTRDKKGREELAYLKGGFGRLAQTLVSAVESSRGEVSFGERATGVCVEGNQVIALRTTRGEIGGRYFLFTPAFPIIADIFEGSADSEWLRKLRRVRYLGNMCLVLRLAQSLSDTYWINVNDPGFPFVGVIEHTNFDAPEHYKGTHIAFISRYLALEDPVWSFSDEEYLDYALQHLKRMFPELDESWLIEYRVWRAEHAQPVTELNYSEYVPGTETPFSNVFISTMAQVYPEDRGTNYAIREGREIAQHIFNLLSQ